MNSEDLKNTLLNFVSNSQDGYGIYDENDILIYSNEKFASVMCVPRDKIVGMTFEDLMRHIFTVGQGINIEADNIESWLEYVRGVRRSRKFRLFEVDFTDGRWFLFSEQIDDKGQMLVQLKDMTKQKLLEKGLESSVENLKEIALTDELTRVANRRSFVTSVNTELSRCRRTGASMSFLIFDLDYFKNINDTYGHPIGDKVLIHITQLISKSLRAYDILGRIGGEEFGVFLSNTPTDEAYEIAERIRQTIAESPLFYEATMISLSTSIGLTTKGCNARFEELYQEADQALYSAKEGGRNQVVVYR
ncbi:diguanylate cyclase [Aliikangiella marina]|uniref:diguanylate cyclase n=1 Tax=Aliikangiella marina TaxID=1712262 RepID=A0A545T6H2_9GAMM|nr:sensor domain-containing diguanylate cyclase [Aliikangiella marina]TQV72772.1 diguanylate cyclase [Aliikangiella marina]